MIQLESMQFEKLAVNDCIAEYYPYRSFYAAGNIVYPYILQK